jgi:hypothetical protein
VLFTVGFAALVKMSFLLDGEPYTMTITPFEGGAQIQFLEPSAHYVSPVFKVDVPFQSPYVVKLDSDELPIPGATIEFSDTTPMPGRFKIRVGQTLFDIMEERIFVDRREYSWIRKRPGE